MKVLNKNMEDVRFQVFIAVLLRYLFFWDLTSCHLVTGT